MENNKNHVELHKAQLVYGDMIHWLTIVSCIIALFAPVFCLMFPKSNILNPGLVFEAIFDGKKTAQIWQAAGISVDENWSFWKSFFDNFFTAEGFAILGIVAGCSVTLWGLIPAIGVFFKKKEYLYVGISIFVMALIILAMSGILAMGG